MARPCDCGRAAPGTPFVRGRDCAPCWRRANGDPAAHQVVVVATCSHRGPRVRVAGSAKDWHACDHPRRVPLGLADVACPCAGCGPKCLGYEAET